MELTIDRLSKSFGHKTAVNGVSTRLTPGVYGLLGANGAGKTTLMRMVCDILRPSSGRLLFNGTNIRELGTAYRSLLGYLPQDFGYYPEFTALDFMLYLAALKGIDKKTAKSRSNSLLDLVGLSDVRTAKVRTFSGGMRQRLGIAQAVLNDPTVLILDEPTAGLDPKERVRFRNLISGLAQGKIVLLSTHIVSDVEHIADHVLVMKDGSFALQGTARDVVSHVDGKVWEYTTSAAEADTLAERLCVSNVRYDDAGRAILRIVSNSQPFPHARPVSGTLEDLYMYVFSTTDTPEQTVTTSTAKKGRNDA
jgi:ABC-2 type transport system ATP-binding protein